VGHHVAMQVGFWFDPGCPWCWRTSRWLLDVAPHRDVHIHWNSISLLLKNGGPDKIAAQYRGMVLATHRMLRVAERLRAAPGAGNEAVGRFYTELGAQIHHDGVAPADVDLRRVLQALGCDAALADAADDETLDGAIRASVERGLSLAGEDVGTPIISIDDHVAFFGPVLDPIPSGDAALRVFDAVVALATTAGFWELKRSRTGPPTSPGPRPATALAPGGKTRDTGERTASSG